MELEKLIEEGKSFKMKWQPPREAIYDGFSCIEKGQYYFEDGNVLFGWVEKCKRFIGINYPNDQAYVDFSRYADSELSDKSIAKMTGILIALKEVGGTCTKHEHFSQQAIVNVSQSQSQIQSQTTDIVINKLHEEFSNDQVEKIREIVESQDAKTTKRGKLLTLLKDFGMSVGADILVSLLLQSI